MLLTWVPLLVLSAVQGLAIGHDVSIPYLYGFAAYARFLVAVPLLILAEGLIEHHIAGVAAHFRHARLVPERQYPEYEAALDRALRLRDSTLAEVVLFGLAGVSVAVMRNEFPFTFPRGFPSSRTQFTSARGPAGGIWSWVWACFSSCSGDGSGDCASGTGFSGGCRSSTCN